MFAALNDLDHLHCLSKMNCDGIIDNEVTVVEIEAALRKLKLGKASGIDGLQPEHFKLGGSLLILWLKQIFDAFVQFEHVSSHILHFPCKKMFRFVVLPCFNLFRSDSFHVNTQLEVGHHWWFNYPGPLLNVELKFACLSS